MRALAFIATFLAVLAPVSQSAAQEQCSLVMAASVPMSIGQENLPVIPVQMNGHDANLLIDTGAPVSLISALKVVEFGLPRKPFPSGVMVLANGTSMTETATINALTLGRLVGKNVVFFIIPSGDMPSAIAGSFGTDFLRAWDVDFDFGGGKFNLISPKHCKGQVVYWTTDPYVAMQFRVDDSDHVKISVKLDGRTLRAALDTGASITSMPLELAERLFKFDTSSPKLKRSAASANEKSPELNDIYEYPFQSLDLNGISVRNPLIGLIPHEQLGDVQIILGMSLIQKLHLYISYKEQIIYLTTAGAH